jgi:hypothetical protein
LGQVHVTMSPFTEHMKAELPQSDAAHEQERGCPWQGSATHIGGNCAPPTFSRQT